MTMARVASVSRQTAETSIEVTVNLDGTGTSDISTGVGFFDHMLTALCRHSLIDMDIAVTGDTWVDDHHTVEDTGIALGQAIREALGDKRGIRRFGDALVPLDEALIMAAVDISGRGELFWEVPIGPDKVGTFDTELGHEFFCGFARDAGMTLHLREVCGSENKMNMLLPWKPNTQTGLPGVNPHGNKFQTSIYGKSVYFHDPYEAFYHLTLLGRRYKSEKV